MHLVKTPRYVWLQTELILLDSYLTAGTAHDSHCVRKSHLDRKIINIFRQTDCFTSMFVMPVPYWTWSPCGDSKAQRFLLRFSPKSVVAKSHQTASSHHSYQQGRETSRASSEAHGASRPHLHKLLHKQCQEHICPPLHTSSQTPMIDQWHLCLTGERKEATPIPGRAQSLLLSSSRLWTAVETSALKLSISGWQGWWAEHPAKQDWLISKKKICPFFRFDMENISQAFKWKNKKTYSHLIFCQNSDTATSDEFSQILSHT